MTPRAPGHWSASVELLPGRELSSGSVCSYAPSLERNKAWSGLVHMPVSDRDLLFPGAATFTLNLGRTGELREQGADVTLMVQGDMLAFHADGEPPQLGLSNPAL